MDAGCVRSRRGARNFARAFTLIELLIAVVVLGIAGALVIPSMGQTDVLRVQAAVRTLVADMVFAQSDALAYQTRRALVFGQVAVPDGSGGWMFQEGNGYVVIGVNGSTIDLAADALPHPERADRPFYRNFAEGEYGGATLGSIDFNGGDLLIFDELGGPVADLEGDAPGVGGNVTIEGTRARFRVDVQPYTGRVRVTKTEDVT